MKPLLPNEDPKPGRRAAALEAARAEYTYSYDLLKGVPFAATVPEEDGASKGWLALVAERIVTIAINSAQVDSATDMWDPNHPEHGVLRRLVQSGRMGGAAAIIDHISQSVLTGWTMGKAMSNADFGRLFQHTPTPPHTLDFAEDGFFAWLRLGGPNPLTIKRIDRLPDHFPVTEELFGHVTGHHETLEAGLKEGRVYLTDYAVLAGAEGGTFPHGAQKYVAPAMGLFLVPSKSAPSQALWPIAVQCGQTPGPDTPIITPAHRGTWPLARVVLNCADGNVHQAISHLARTHLVLEPFVLATRRQLAEAHPVRLLLDPHFEGTLEINDAAQSRLIAPGGGVDAVLGGTIESSRAAAVAGWESFRFDDMLPLVELANRGVDDVDLLPEYPYRDDTKLLWPAIRRWVGGYLALYYGDDAAVQSDPELQAWMGELVSKDGGRMRGLGQGGRVMTRSYLADTVAMVIWTASCQHAAVNFPQYDVMAWAAGYPLALFRPPPTEPIPPLLTEQALYELLPPLDLAQYQGDLGFLLGSLHYTKLGHYPRRRLGLGRWFQDGRVDPLLEAFQTELEGIERTILDRNQRRRVYRHLLPSRIPQSINI